MLFRSKSAPKKEAKRIRIGKTISDAVLITPSQFIMETQGILSDAYEFKNKLGQGIIKNIVGTYGTVYEAFHKKTKEKRAIKVIDKQLIETDNENELFSEIKVLKEMDHPSIMKIYEFSSDKNFYYLVQE